MMVAHEPDGIEMLRLTTNVLMTQTWSIATRTDKFDNDGGGDDAGRLVAYNGMLIHMTLRMRMMTIWRVIRRK